MRTKTIATLAAAALVIAGGSYAYGATTAAPATPITTLTFCQSTTGEMKAVSATAACPKRTTKYQLSGVVGPVGPQGVQGVPGPQGPAGTPASTCYEYPHPGANYSGCDLSGVNLESSHMAGANVAGANFSGAVLDSGDWPGKMSLWHGVNAHLANFTGASMNHMDLSGADATGANFTNAALVGINFSDSNLTGAIGIRIQTGSYTNWTRTICPDGTMAHFDPYELYAYSCAGDLVPA